MAYKQRRFVSKLNDKSLDQVLSAAHMAKSTISFPLEHGLAKGLDRLAAQGILNSVLAAVQEDKRIPHDVFICRSSKDQEFARKLANDLESNGYRVWLDEFEMLPGDSLYEKIQHGIKNSAWFLIVLTSDSVESKWCKRELHNAMEEEFERNSVYVVPVMYKPCQVPGFLKEKVWASFQGRKYRTGLNQLLKTLSRGKPRSMKTASA